MIRLLELFFAAWRLCVRQNFQVSSLKTEKALLNRVKELMIGRRYFDGLSCGIQKLAEFIEQFVRFVRFDEYAARTVFYGLQDAGPGPLPGGHYNRE